MKSLLALLFLVGCAKHPIIVWAGQSTGEDLQIVVDSGGHVRYTTTVDGIPEVDESISFTKGQIREIGDLFRSHNACQLAHDPTYTPGQNEGQTTLELTLDDLQCKVTMYDLEWQRGNGRDIAETMRSMRPLHGRKREPRKLDPRGASS